MQNVPPVHADISKKTLPFFPPSLRAHASCTTHANTFQIPSSFRPIPIQHLSNFPSSYCVLHHHNRHRRLVSLRSNLAGPVQLPSARQAARERRLFQQIKTASQEGHLMHLKALRMLTLEANRQEDDAVKLRKLRQEQLNDQLAQPIYWLPAELILNIIDHINITEMPATIAGLYHLLVIRHIVPDLLPRTLFWARGLLSWPLELISNSRFFWRHQNRPQLPVELSLQIQQYLTPRDKINLVLAIYQIPSKPRNPTGHSL